jgi:2-oxoglutarate ferredoxin oxidoreductase subunit alpha
MMDKRLGKFEGLKREAVMPTLFGPADAAAVAICWGSTRMIAAEAAERLRAEGVSISVLHFAQLWPLTGAMVAPFALEAKKLISIEGNATGQFAGLLRQELGMEINHRVLKYDGDCFTVEELCQALRGLLG